MAAENLKSGSITNRDATPSVLSNSMGGIVRQVWGKVEAAGGDAGSTYRFAAIPSNARAIRIWFSSDDLSGAGATMDVGLYQTTANGGAVVDADFFASALDVATAAVAITEITFERGATLIDEIEKPLWERLGLSADSNREYDITGVSGTAAATGTMAVFCTYVV
ncbi:MAG TPA: hypothetical protein VFH31_05480 [Pyrinomonadaceae bacterium]|nr:hypothetical protein [Pyrinomonadaceae bacterium]